MNNFTAFWLRLCQKTPALLKEETKMTITVASFKRSMQKAYEQGTVDKAALVSELEKVGKKPTSPVDDFMEKYLKK